MYFMLIFYLCRILLFVMWNIITWIRLLKLVSTIFYQMFIFSQNDNPLKTMKNVSYFIEKALPILEIFRFLKFFPFLSFPFHTFQIQKDKQKWNNLWCHELTCINLQCNFWNNSKTALHYIIKLDQIIYNE